VRRFFSSLFLLLLLTSTAAYAQSAPTSAADYFKRGYERGSKGDSDGAIADFSAAISDCRVQPENGRAVSHSFFTFYDT
jgi:hypothetical protein